MPNILFVTATDTGVGKTVASAALLQQAIAAGKTVAYFKPAQTGVGPSEPGDADFIRATCAYRIPASALPQGEVGPRASREPGEGESRLSYLTPPASPLLAPAPIVIAEGLRLPDPLAPAEAAARANIAIDISALLQQAHAIAARCDLLVVEGAGGLLVPFTEHCYMADFAYALGAELVIVVRPGLGTLNHTAITLECARTRQNRIRGILICGWPESPGLAEQTNLRRLANMAPLLGRIPFIPGLDTAAPKPAPIPILDQP